MNPNVVSEEALDTNEPAIPAKAKLIMLVINRVKKYDILPILPSKDQIELFSLSYPVSSYTSCR